MAAGVVLVLSLLCLCGVRAEEEASDGYKAPHFCRESECPRFQLVKKYEAFELREYEGSRWVTTPLEFDFLGIGLYKSFNRLYNYLNGENLEGIKIKLTLPVRIFVPLINPTDRNATMSLFVPSSVVKAPQPLYEEVYLESVPPQSIYVKSFGGYALKSDYDHNAKLLAEELEALNLPFDRTYGIAAGYSDLLTFFDRHNEAWYIAL